LFSKFISQQGGGFLSLSVSRVVVF
jgi:hypothetical protein